MNGIALFEHSLSGHTNHFVLGLITVGKIITDDQIRLVDFFEGEIDDVSIHGTFERGYFWQTPKADIKKVSRFLSFVMAAHRKMPETEAGYRFDCLTAIAYIFKRNHITSPHLAVDELERDEQFINFINRHTLEETSEWKNLGFGAFAFRNNTTPLQYHEAINQLRYPNQLSQETSCKPSQFTL